MSLAEIKIFPKPVNEELVEYLESALERAKAGELLGVLMLQRDDDGLAYSVCGIKDRYEATGYLFHLLYKLQAD